MGRRGYCWAMMGEMEKSNAKHDSLKAKVRARWTSADMGAIISISRFSSVKREYCHEQMEWSWTSHVKKNLRTCRAQTLYSKLSKSQLRSSVPFLGSEHEAPEIPGSPTGARTERQFRPFWERRKVKFTYTKLVQTEVLDRAAHFKQAEDKKKWDRNYVTYCD